MGLLKVLRQLLGRDAETIGVTRVSPAAIAYKQADLLRDGQITRDQALAAIAAHHPELTSRQVERQLGQALFETR
ncbi:hypothetical protein AB0J74_15160 [Asanoa sp. NPDC049573]|uniref:hypothetical protein n=1 Tax=Asanoa sp. NPDC049573 TaxID=3155396 RepID=UPI003438A79B